MKNSKLIDILKTFSKAELSEFKKFVASPYHSRGKNCLPLLRELQKAHPDFEIPKLTYENLHAKLYPGKKFNKQVMWNLASAMEKMLEEFLIQLSLKNSFEKQMFLMKEYSSRKLKQYYGRQLDKMESYFSKKKIDRSYFTHKFYAEKFREEFNYIEDRQHMLCENVLKGGEYLILNFLMEISEIINNLNVNYVMYNANYTVNIPLKFMESLQLKQIADYAKENGFQYSFIIEICYYYLMTILEPGKENHFHSLKDTFYEHETEFTLYEKYNITSAMVSYCIGKISSGVKGYRKIVFEIDEYRLREGLIFYPEGQIPKNIYKQMSMNANMLGKFEWSREFIDKYAGRLKPEFQKAMHSLCSAFLNFELKEFDLVLRNLNKVEYIDVRDKMHVKIITAKTHYELNRTETLLSYIDASKHFLKNSDTVNDERKKSFSVFFNFLHKMVIAKENNDTDAISLYKNELEQTQNVSSKKWLLEKLTELEN